VDRQRQRLGEGLTAQNAAQHLGGLVAHRIGLATVLAALLGSTSALAQHAVRPKDAEAPLEADTPEAEPLVNTPAAKKAAPAPSPEEPEGKKDAGPPQKFKDDITADELKEQSQSSAKVSSADCSSGCEALTSRTLESTAFTLHVRPAQPKPGKVAEVVLEVFEVMDPPDPEYGERKPVTGEQLVAHVEGIGRFLLHPIERNDGAYGFHFTPTAAGTRDIELDRLNGKPGLKVSFHVPVGQPPAKGVELRDWHAAGPDRYQSVSVGPAHGSSSDMEGE
jgi:hypothetical protein